MLTQWRIVSASILIFVLPTLGLAQIAPDMGSDVGSESLFGDRFTLKAGYKVWIAKWQAPLGTTGGVTQITSDHPSVMSGPTFTGRLKLRDGEWFNSAFASFYWLNAGFDFQEARFSVGTTTFNTQNFALRRDYAITAGFTIWEGFGVFAGYYDNRQQFTTINRSITTATQSTFLITRKLKGPIFGIFGSAPVSERVSVYGNLAYALLEFEAATPAGPLSTNAVHGYATELGINISGPRVWRIGTELQLGFRYQEIQKTFGGGLAATGNTGFETIANDITYGPTFTINAVF